MHLRNGRTPSALWLTAAWALAGCGGDSGMGMPAPLVPASALIADSNRDGVVNGGDQKYVVDKTTWSAGGGALFLANVDDDDSDGNVDAADDVVNGPEDEKDLARVLVWPWPQAPMTASGRIELDGELAAAAVNVFRKQGDTWVRIALPHPLSPSDLVSGIELGIEARDFVQKLDPAAWDGKATLRLTVTDSAQPTTAMAHTDAVVLRVAPFVMVHNLSSIFQVWNANVGDKGGLAFRRDLVTLSDAGSAELEDANGLDDPWTEDWWQIGITFMPSPDGPHGMRVAQRSAQPDRPAGEWALWMLGPDFGYIWPHTESDQGQEDGKSYSLDSFGNHDTLPPFAGGADSFPLGRTIIGGSKKARIDSVVRSFYEAQAVQPLVEVDTTWLLVGHIDEMFSYAQAKTPRGWKLLVASPKLARTMLMDLSKQGHGADKMFAGKYFLDANFRPIKADVTVDALLADEEIMMANDTAQQKMDAGIAALKKAIGLTDDEIVEIPFLFERVFTGEPSSVNGYEFIAHMVGTVNLREVNGVLGIGKPHGVVVDGVDWFEKDLKDRLSTPVSGLGTDGMGLPITFVEDWDDYHIFGGEVHCGTNTGVTSMPTVAWWQAGR